MKLHASEVLDKIPGGKTIVGQEGVNKSGDRQEPVMSEKAYW